MTPTPAPEGEPRQDAVLPCPICGADPGVSKYDVDDETSKWAAGCNGDGAPEGWTYVEHYIGVHADTKAEVIAAWNSRPAPDAPTNGGEGDIRLFMKARSAIEAGLATLSGLGAKEGGRVSLMRVTSAEITARLAQPNPSQQGGAEGVLEAVARIIDPETWERTDRYGDLYQRGGRPAPDYAAGQKAPSLEKAGAVLFSLFNGHAHTAILDAVREDVVRQHPGAFTEDTDSEIVIPVGAVPVQFYVKLDVSSLAEAALAALNTSEAGGATK